MGKLAKPREEASADLPAEASLPYIQHGAVPNRDMQFSTRLT